jgi:hypothetical protein
MILNFAMLLALVPADCWHDENANEPASIPH